MHTLRFNVNRKVHRHKGFDAQKRPSCFSEGRSACFCKCDAYVASGLLEAASSGAVIATMGRK